MPRAEKCSADDAAASSTPVLRPLAIDGTVVVATALAARLDLVLPSNQSASAPREVTGAWLTSRIAVPTLVVTEFGLLIDASTRSASPAARSPAFAGDAETTTASDGEVAEADVTVPSTAAEITRRSAARREGCFTGRLREFHR